MTDQTTKGLVNQGDFLSLTYVYVINKDKIFKPEVFEWNPLIKQIYLV